MDFHEDSSMKDMEVEQVKMPEKKKVPTSVNAARLTDTLSMFFESKNSALSITIYMAK